MKFKYWGKSIFVFCITILLSCRKEAVLIEITKELPEFKEVILNSTFTVFLTQDTSYNLKIVGHPDFIDEVKFEVEYGVLSVDFKSKKKWLNPKENKVTLYINSDSLKLLQAKETCYIETLNPIVANEFGLILSSKLNEAKINLACNTFYYWNIHPCGGKLTLLGEVTNLKIWNVGIMSVEAENLLVKDYAYIENKSKASCRIRVLNKLDYGIYGEGNIYLYGNTIDLNEMGLTSSGRLIKIN